LERLISAGVPLDINCPVLTTNYGSVSDVLVWARERDVPAGPTLAIMGQSNCETKNLGHRATAEQIAEVIKDLKDLGYLDVAITDKSTATYHENETCGVGWDKLCMEHDGNIYPCPGWGRYCLGNIENETIFSIWNNSEKLSALRRITYDSFPKCKGCNLRQYCTVCLVRNANENNGDMFQLCPHVCDVALLLKNAFDEKSMSVK
jgi:radical SAM protein with 4Fe4S-binding SPASM domain